MTDKKIEIEFGIDGRLTGPLATSLRQAHDFANEIERIFGRTAAVGAEMSKQLGHIQKMNKALSAGLAGVSGGAPVSRVINANTSGRNADARADKRLIDTFEKVTRELGSGASEARLKKAFREALVAGGLMTRSPTNTAQEFNRSTLPLYERAKAGLIAERNERLNADFDRAQRENRARDYIEHRRNRLNGERFEDNSMRANAAHDDRVRTRALKQIEREELWALNNLRADAKHDDGVRERARKLAEKKEDFVQRNMRAAALYEDRERTRQAGFDEKSRWDAAAYEDKERTRRAAFADSSRRANAAHDDRVRTRLERNVNNQTRARLSQGGFESMIARGDTTGAANLVQQVRGQIQQRFGRQATPQALNQIMDDAGSRASLAQGKLNIASVDRDLKSFFLALKKMGHDAEEEMRRLRAQAQHLADSRGINPAPVLRTAERMSEDFDQRRDALGTRAPRPTPIPRPVRPPREPSSRIDRLGGRMQLFGDYAAIGAVVGSAGFVGTQVIQLQKSLSTLKAISQATTSEMQDLQKVIFGIGQVTGFTNTEIAEAATVLAQAGYSASQVADTLPAIANLAQATGAALGDSTAIVSSVLTVFDKGMAETTYVVDALTEALNKSKLGLDQLSLGVQYAGNISANSGVSFEEMTAALGAMSNAGIRSGSTLGTGFRAMLQELIAPSEKFQALLQAQGIEMSALDIKSHGLINVLKTLRDKGFDAEDALQVFDVRAASAFAALTNNFGTFEELAGGFSQNGAAAFAAAQQMDTLAAQTVRLGNASVELLNTFGGPLLDGLQGLIKGTADLFTVLAGGPAVLGKLFAATLATVAIFKVASITQRVFTAEVIASNVAIGAGGLVRMMKAAGAGLLLFVRNTIAATTATGTLRGAVVALTGTMLANPFLLVATAIAAVVAGLILFGDSSKNAKDKAEKFRTAANELKGELTETQTVITDLQKFTDDLSTSQKSVAEQVDEARARFGQYGTELEGTITTTQQLIVATQNLGLALSTTNLLRAEQRETELVDEAEALRDKHRTDVIDAVNGNLFPMDGHKMRREFRTRVQTNEHYVALSRGEGTEANYNGLRDFTRGLQGDASLNPTEARVARKIWNDLQTRGVFVEGNQNRLNTLDNNRALARGRVDGSPEAIQLRESLREINVFAANNAGANGLLTSAQGNYDADFDAIARSLEAAVTLLASRFGLEEADVRALLKDPRYLAASGLRSGNQPETAGQITRATTQAENQYVRTRSDADRQALLARYRTEEGGSGDAERSGFEINAAAQTRLEQFIDTRILNQEVSSRRRTLERTRNTARARMEESANTRWSAESAPATTGTNFILPTSGGRTPGQGFGVVRPDGSTHRGMDLIARSGTRAVAPAGGMATVGTDPVNGNYIEIDHGGGLVSKLIHLTDAVVGLSSVATRVEQGDQIGRTGNSGSSSRGAHLHWQVKLNGVPVDPESLVSGTVPVVADVMKEINERFEADFEAYRQSELAIIRNNSLDLSDAERAAEMQAAEAALAQEKTEALRGRLSQAYATIVADFAVQSDEAINAAINAALTGSDTTTLTALAVTALETERDTLIDQVLATELDPNKARVEVEAITVQFADRTSQTLVDILQAQAEGLAVSAADVARANALTLARSQGNIDARSNSDAQRNGSRAFDTVNRRDSERQEQANARENLRQLSVDLAARQLDESAAGTQLLAAAGTSQENQNKRLREYQEAQAATKDVQLSLELANIAFESMTRKAHEYKTPMDAIRGGWAAFIEEANLARPVLNSLADGLQGTFNTAKEGFKGLLTDVLSGTKSMGDAFKDLAMSILGSLLDLATEILAQEILKMIVGMFVGNLGGSFTGVKGTGIGGVTATGMKGAYQGGMIPRRAAGGMAPSPNRDSVLTFTQPGEFIMSKTATDFIGADTLSEMNASGNRRMKQLPTVASSMPKRVPDEVNVWVVPPNQRPPMGKKDIIAAVTDDMMMNGQTKRLIKAIQVGAM